MARTALLCPLVLTAALACCGAPPAPTHPAVPPLPEERVPTPPASSETLIWQPGHYDWDGATYVWIPGEWVPRAGHGPLWQDGMWDGPTWVPAHWL